jgi:S1-C subfamily serine protease
MSFPSRLLLVTAAGAFLVILWNAVPAIRATLLAPMAEPRLVTPRGDLAADEQSIIALFEATREGVVSIATLGRVRDPWTRNVHAIPRGTGSGFLWDDLGHVVTNDHVIEGASEATVRLADGRSYRAALVGRSPAHDLAVLRIAVPGSVPPALPLGSSAGLRVGQKVFAIGNPFGLDWTLTTGIVSALGRELPTESGVPIRDLIQTDAAINPGNSGGPLLDSAGRLIGVNTAIYSPSGASAGIGFAVPVDVVNRVVPELIARGRYSPPVIGIRTDPRADMLARRAGIPGVLVLGVEAGSPAAAAGLRPARITEDGRLLPGDAIVGLDGRAIGSGEELDAALAEHRPGERVRLAILRDGARIEVEVVLAAGG